MPWAPTRSSSAPQVFPTETRRPPQQAFPRPVGPAPLLGALRARAPGLPDGLARRELHAGPPAALPSGLVVLPRLDLAPGTARGTRVAGPAAFLHFFRGCCPSMASVSPSVKGVRPAAPGPPISLAALSSGHSSGPKVQAPSLSPPWSLYFGPNGFRFVLSFLRGLPPSPPPTPSPLATITGQQPPRRGPSPSPVAGVSDPRRPACSSGCCCCR